VILYDRERVHEEHERPYAQLLDGEFHRYPLGGAKAPHLLDEVARIRIELFAHPEEKMIQPILLKDDRHTELLASIGFRRINDEFLQRYAVG
jgi:hypothetical protein